MCPHRKSKFYVTSILREKISVEAVKGDIVSETVEEILANRKTAKNQAILPVAVWSGEENLKTNNS